MEISIRHVRPEDVEAVHEILLGEHVISGTMRLPYQTLDHTRQRLEPSAGVFKIVALVEAEIVGFAELITYPDTPRHRHVGEVNMIATHQNWLSKGVAHALMEALLDLADNWLQLTRLGLIVWTNNEAAVRLYQKLGFAIEGTLPAYAFGEGAYLDAYQMGRVIRIGGPPER